MTDRKILEMAIEKARLNGWSFFNFQGGMWRVSEMGGYVKGQMVEVLREGKWNQFACHSEIIFNHDFAKALWGEGAHAPGVIGYGIAGNLHEWAWHLQQMVIAENPLTYLSDNIES